jgi:subtilisin family serine protease
MNFEYIVAGKVVSLPVDPTKVAVQFKEPSTQETRRASVEAKHEVGTFDNRIEIPGEKITIIDLLPSRAESEGQAASAAHAALRADTTIGRILPVFNLGSAQAIPSNRILIGFHPEVNAQVRDIVDGLNGKILRADEEDYLIELPDDVDPLDTVNKLAKLPEISYAEPDFITIGNHIPEKPPTQSLDGTIYKPVDQSAGMFDPQTENAAVAVGDPLVGKQYALQITRTVLTRSLVRPAREITIAILDEGVDTRHPDLAGAIVGTYDATNNDTNQQPQPWDAHGTACAGLAAAIPDNGIGIEGIAGGCSLLAVRLAYSIKKGGSWITSNSQIIAAIDWAWKHGAAVLSNSWTTPPSEPIRRKFEEARTLGRDGKGCVIVTAAGNYSGPVNFPGTLPNVLTVSASNEYDEPKTKTSRDGEYWWGSNFGADVDIAAPGVHNYTTDIIGLDGYNEAVDQESGDYTDFNGTSSATPIVAGVAALVLSANPQLTEAQVRRIITGTADKVGKVVYQNGHSHQMGYGRINALEAVQAAIQGSLV